MKQDVKRIVIVSDGTGKTAKRLMDAVLAQYSDQKVKFSVEAIYQQVRTKRRIREILREVDDDYLVIFSLISESLRLFFHDMLDERKMLYLDVLTPMLETLSKFLGVHPDYRPGLLQIIDDRYYDRIDGIGFTVEHDDGRGDRIEEADLVLVGLSRTCKTPISMYITCNYGLKVANIPVIADLAMREQLLQRLSRVEPARILGLIMQPEALAHVREKRAEMLVGHEAPQRQMDQYFDIDLIKQEHRFCLRLFADQDWEVIDVTRRAIEEVSSEIIKYLVISGDRPDVS